MLCMSLIICLLIGISRLGDALVSSSWQGQLDKAILSVDATVEGRIRNLQKVVKDPALRTDLKEALDILREKGVGKGHPDVINLLWPEGTVTRGDLEGLTAVRRQLPELNRELRESPPSPPSRPDLSNLSAPNLSLPKRDEIEDEFKNIFRSTPKGLKTPKYDILKTLEGEISLGVPEKVEIRSYGPFTIATTQSMGGAGFNTLASYLFGRNENNEKMEMTTPVLTTPNGSMSFVLPKENEVGPPNPEDMENIKLEKREAQVVAIKAFPGLVTMAEVERQKAALIKILNEAPGVKIFNEEKLTVLQYNSPITLPWRRRNEVALIVELEGGDAGDAEGVQNQWYSRTVALSWYDAGIRL